jgi:hypothetical protein
MTDHSGICDVDWVNGTAVWTRAFVKHGAARICEKCYKKLGFEKGKKNQELRGSNFSTVIIDDSELTPDEGPERK